MKRYLTPLIVGLALTLGGCGILGGGNPTPLQAAQEQVLISATGCDTAAVTAMNAYKAGFIKPNTAIETDVTFALHGCKAAVDSANVQLHAGNAGNAGFYLAQVGAFVAQLNTDFAAAGVKQP